jgi:hypothetical protein
MGQTVVGVLYGAAVPRGVDLWEDDGDEQGLLEQWQRLGPRRGGDARGYRAGYAWPPGASRPVVGYWVALNGGNVAGVPRLDDRCVRVSALRRLPANAKARRAWRRFARWARSRGVALQRPTLWIAPTGVA